MDIVLTVLTTTVTTRRDEKQLGNEGSLQAQDRQRPTSDNNTNITTRIHLLSRRHFSVITIVTHYYYGLWYL